MLYFCTRMYEGESTARHSSTAKTLKMKPKLSGRRKIPVPSRVIIFCLIGTPYTRSKSERKKKKIKQKSSLSLVRRPPLSRPSRNRFGPGKAFLPVCHSELRRPPHVKPGATLALVCQLSFVANIYTAQFLFCVSQRPLYTRYIV